MGTVTFLSPGIGGGSIGGTIAANQVAYGSGVNTITGSNLVQFNGTDTFTIGDDVLLKLGTTSSIGLINQSSFASPYPYLSANSDSNLFVFGDWANRNFDYFDTPGLSSTQPVFILTSEAQSRNRFGFMSVRDSSASFDITAENGDDIDGTARNAAGTSINIRTGEGGTLGGRGGSLTLQTGPANAGDNSGGDILIDLGDGSGAGVQGNIIANDNNGDLRFKLNGTGLFRIESNNDSASALTFGYNTGSGRALIDNSAAGGSLQLSLDTYMSGRFNELQGADTPSTNNLALDSTGNTFEITGNTQINAIETERWQNGSKVTLLFSSNPTVKHNTAGGAGTAVILLNGAADFGATAGDTLTLVLCEIGGTQAWREIGRAVI